MGGTASSERNSKTVRFRPSIPARREKSSCHLPVSRCSARRAIRCSFARRDTVKPPATTQPIRCNSIRRAAHSSWPQAGTTAWKGELPKSESVGVVAAVAGWTSSMMVGPRWLKRPTGRASIGGTANLSRAIRTIVYRSWAGQRQPSQITASRRTATREEVQVVWNA